MCQSVAPQRVRHQSTLVAQAVRQLLDLRSGACGGVSAPLMKATVANLTVEDMTFIAAYLASLSL